MNKSITQPTDVDETDARGERKFLRMLRVNPDDPRPFSELKADLSSDWGDDMARRCLKAIARIRRARSLRYLRVRPLRCRRPVTRAARPIGCRSRTVRRASKPTALGDPDPEPEPRRRASSSGGMS
jgi:hypothetical protein